MVLKDMRKIRKMQRVIIVNTNSWDLFDELVSKCEEIKDCLDYGEEPLR